MLGIMQHQGIMQSHKIIRVRIISEITKPPTCLDISLWKCFNFMNEAIGGSPSIHPTPWLSHQKNSSDSIPVENEQEMTKYNGSKGEILGLCEFFF